MRKSIKKEELIAVLQRMENEDLYNFFLRCCEVENLDLCQICLDAGFNVNSRESTYGTPVIVMLVSTEKLTIKVADWLIKKGADINLKDNAGHSSLTLACCNRNYEYAKYFIEKGAIIQGKDMAIYSSDLCNAVSGNGYGGNIEIVRLLLDAGAPLEADDTSAYNPLITAIKNKNAEMVELFLERGANPNFYNYGIMPIHLAVAIKEIEIVRVLLKYGADANAKVKKQSGYIKEYLAITPLDIAIYKADEEMQELLKSYGAKASSQEEKIEMVMQAYSNSEQLHPLLKRIFTFQEKK